jgi:hypothetical protein
MLFLKQLIFSRARSSVQQVAAPTGKRGDTAIVKISVSLRVVFWQASALLRHLPVEWLQAARRSLHLSHQNDNKNIIYLPNRFSL